MTFLPAKRILAFSESKVLVAVFKSIAVASWVTKVRYGTINDACKSRKFVRNLYWRFQAESVIIEIEDIGKLKLDEYSHLAKVDTV